MHQRMAGFACLLLVLLTQATLGEARVTLVSRSVVSASGAQGTGPLLVLGNGAVLFHSNARDLIAGVPTGPERQLYRRELGLGQTGLISWNRGTRSAGGDVFLGGASADGRWVVFASEASDITPQGIVDGNRVSDVFLRDTTTGVTTTLSLNAAGTNTGNGASESPSITPDGRYVVFRSRARTLVNGIADDNGGYDVFVRDVVAGTTTLVSIASGGGATGNGESGVPRITADGRFVVFDSRATDLVAGAVDSNSTRDVFRRDLMTQATLLVSRTAAGNAGNGESHSPLVSDDGSRIAFQSRATDLVVAATDVNGAEDVFVRDLTAAETRLVSATPAGNAGSTGAQLRGMTANGARVLFTSDANDLVANDNNGAIDVFLRDLAAGTTTLVSVSRSGGSANGASGAPVMTPQGDVVAFESGATDLVADFTDRNGVGSDVYVRDLTRGATDLVSATSSGGGGNGASGTPALSPDGRTVAFASTAADLAGSVSGVGDVFVRDLGTRQTSLVSVASGERKSGNERSGFLSTSPDGRWIAFESSASDLVAAGIDENGNADVFLHDRTSGTTRLVSVTPAGKSGNDASGATLFHLNRFTPDGRFVLFNSSATDLVGGVAYPAGRTQVFWRDMQGQTTKLVSINAAGTAGADALNEVLGISDDGRYALFSSGAPDLVAGFVDGNGVPGFETNQDLFLRDMQLNQTILVSVNAAGTASGNRPTRTAILSSNGRRVVFESQATNLAVGLDANGDDYDVFVRDLDAGQTRFVTINVAGDRSANSESTLTGASLDGRFVTFFSFASDLTPGFVDGNGPTADTFVRDVALGTTTLVSVNAAGTAGGNNLTQGAGITPDGRFAVFSSQATDLADPAGAGAFVRDLLQSHTELVSVNAAGNGSASPSSSALGVSDDGRYATFRTVGLVLPGISGVQIYRRDLTMDTAALVTRSLTGGGSTGDTTGAGPTSLSADGQAVAFVSEGNDLTPDDLNGVRDIFVWDPLEVPTITPTMLRTATPTLSRTPTPTPTGGTGELAGDCDKGGGVTVEELIRAVAISKDLASLATCMAADLDDDGEITPEEIRAAVANALVAAL